MFTFIGNLLRITVLQPILNLLLIIYNYVGDFGLSIIIFTIIIKIFLYPLLKSQIVQTKRMQDLKPEIDKIKKKTKGNRQLESIMTMNLYKQNDIKMSKTFLIALIQLPIFISMFRIIRYMLTDLNYIGSQAYPFVKNLSNIEHLLSNQDKFKPLLFNVIDLSQIPFKFEMTFDWLAAVIILIGMAYVQNLSLNMANINYSDDKKDKRKLKDILNEAADGKEPDQAEISGIMMSKMNKFMVFFMIISFGAFYSGLALYSFLTGVFTLIQRKIILSKIKQTEIKSVDNKEVEKRLKKAKEAEIIMQNFKKNKKKSKKYSKSKPVKKKNNKSK